MKRILFALTASCICSLLYAQDSTSLDEVVVTANKVSQKQSTTGKVVTVIDQATLQKNAGKSIGELLNYQSGIFIIGANSTLGTNQDIYFRGASTGKVLILIDGVPQSDPSQISNTFDINTIPLQSIERIEILKGAQSTLYGSDAVAGVINIITKKTGVKTFDVTGLASYGSYNTFRSALGVQGRIKKLAYNLNHQYTNSKGFTAAEDTGAQSNFDKDGFKQNSFVGNIGYAITENLSANIFSNLGKYSADIDAGAYRDDADYIFKTKNNNTGLALTYLKNKIDLHATYNQIYSRRDYRDDSVSVGGFSKYAEGKYVGKSQIAEVYSGYKVNEIFSFLAGAQYQAQQTEQNYLSLSSFGPFKTALGDSARINNTSAYLSAIVNEKHGFTLEAGLRYNNHSIYGDNTTFSFNPSYLIDEDTRVFVNISSGFKAPSLYQLYSEYGNKNLRPEISKNYEIGFSSFTNNKKNSLRLVAFKRDIKNVFAFFTDTVTYASQYINRDAQNDFGFEAESKISFGKSNFWTNNFTYVDGAGEEAGIKIKNLYRRPAFTFNSILNLTIIKNLTLVPSFRFIAARTKGLFDAGPAVIPEYYLLNAYAGYKIKGKYLLFVDGQNLTNRKYSDVPGFAVKGSNVQFGINVLSL